MSDLFAPVVMNSAPGYFYAFAYSLSAILFAHHNPKRLNRRVFWVVELAFLALTTGLSYLTDTRLPIFFLPSLLVTITLVFLQILCCCRMSMRNAAYFTLRSFVLGELLASLEGQFFYHAAQSASSWNSAMLELLVALPVLGGGCAVTYLLERRFAGTNRTLIINKKTLLQAALIAVGIYLLSNISNVYQNTPFSSSVTADILLIRTLSDLGGVIMLYAYHMQMQEINSRLEAEMLRQMMETQYANYKLGEKSIALVQQKYHDLKHQIAYLRADLPGKEKVAHLDQMEAELQSFESMTDTGNRVLDTILSGKQMQCQNQGITIHCIAEGGCLDFMTPMDISALFGNALDNAIESVECQTMDRRLPIEVRVGVKKGFIVITVGNSYDGEVQFDGKLPMTSKGDERYHGFGTKSIKAIAEKYEGSAAFVAKDGWFEAKVILPVRFEE